jgi:hypothetical protein
MALVVFNNRVRSFPKLSGDNRFVLAGVGFVFVDYLTEVGPVIQHPVDVRLVPGFAISERAVLGKP